MSQQDDAEGREDSGDRAELPDFVSYLPDRVWYLTTSGQDMWCRRPYTFFFTTNEAASRFAAEMGSGFALAPIGIAAKELVSREGIEALRRLEVTRIFIDPSIDPKTGEVFGTILRLAPVH
ncbi:MAG TPA: hypothetical protein VH877_31850 [Polyangia bacterium]|jgi:hypothetical protein|nr:hypothetical protein [Polyangia bacterium]